MLIDDELNLKLTDFGFAVKVSDKDRLRELCGTPAYMAPEMLRCACDKKRYLRVCQSICHLEIQDKKLFGKRFSQASSQPVNYFKNKSC